MSIKRIVIDEQTKAKELGDNKLQLDIVAYSLNEQNQKEPDAELGLFVNNNFVQTLISDLQGNIKENLILSSDRKGLSIKLQDIRSTIVSDVKDILLSSSIKGDIEEKIIDHNHQAREIYIAQVRLNPWSITSLPEWAQRDPKIAKAALEADGIGVLLGAMPEEIKNNKELVLIAIKKDLRNFHNASNLLQTDEGFALECIKLFGIRIVHVFPGYLHTLQSVKDLIRQANDPWKALAAQLATLEKERIDLDGNVRKQSINNPNSVANQRLSLLYYEEIPKLKSQINSIYLGIWGSVLFSN